MDTSVGRERVLVVEDDAVMQRVLGEVLGREGFEVVGVTDGTEVATQLDRFGPDVVILDLGLPDINGFDLLKEIRSRSDLPVIVLSGRAGESDRVLGLELGADDYVVKPFLNGELVARVRVQLRRIASTPPPSAGPDERSGVSIDPGSREARVEGDLIELTATEFDLLAHLAASPRQVFTRSQLLEAVWESRSEWQSEHTVTEHVRRLRQKVGATRIATVRGVGYRYEPAD